MKTNSTISIFLFLVLVMVTIVLYLLSENQILVSSSSDHAKQFKVIASAATEISSYVKRAEGHLMLYLVLHRDEDREKFPKRLASLNKQIAVLDQTTLEEKSRELLSLIIINNELLKSVGETLIAFHDKEMAATNSFDIEKHKGVILSLHERFSVIRKLGVELATLQIQLENDFKVSLFNKVNKFRGQLVFMAGLLSIFMMWIGSTLFRTFRDLNSEVDKRKQSENHLKSERDQLTEALRDVKTLSGLIPICASCKMIRSDKGYWDDIESFISERSEATFSHGICPDCLKKLYPGI